ncbi:MAG: Rhs element Vgr protein [Armatimonadetes bacterium]|jgi:phage protein D|nr:Rhs element Vgr protein [Armatimonadota bacterium]
MPDYDAILSHFYLTVDGQELSEDDRADILEIMVENSLHLPDLFTIRLSDPDFEWIDRDQFKCGAKVVIYGGYEGSGLSRICAGEVTAVEMDLNAATTPTILVRGYDLSHRLQKGRLSRSFVKMKDSEIVQQIAGEAGISCQADSSGPAPEYVFQNNQTNWEFIQERARRLGFECFVSDDDKLRFRKAQSGGLETVPLQWGMNLRAYRPRISAARQVGQVVVMGWDPKSKKEIIAQTSSANGAPKVAAETGPDMAKRAFQGPKMIVVDRPVHTQDEADKMAASIFEELAQDFLTAEGVALGNPALKAGTKAEIKNLGTKFSGSYYVTSTTHTWNPEEGYMTSFMVGGKHPQTITDLLGDAGGGDRSGKSVLNPAGGNIVVGVVTNNVDPEGLGRIKVKYPWLVKGHDSHWARLSTPMAGPGRGFYWIPEIDDEVLVAFEHGDMHRPYVIGCLWNGQDLPIKKNDECVQDGKVNLRLIRTRYGHDVILDDTKDKEKIVIKTPYGHVVEIDDTKGDQHIKINTKEGHTYTMSDPSGKRYVEVKTKYGHKMRMDDDKKKIDIETNGGHKETMDDVSRTIKIVDSSGTETLTMDAARQGITMEAGIGGITMKTSGNIKMEAMMNLEQKAGMGWKSEATMQAKLVGNLGVDVESPLMVNVKGLMINLN